MSKAGSSAKPKIGLALGGGSARGWAHIGIIEALAQQGIVPDVVCGTSIGALVGGFHVTGRLHTLKQWVLELDRREILRYLDINLLVGGGFIEGKRLIDFFREEHIGDAQIEALDITFGAVATNLASGQEIWLREGSILDAIRASIALPGFFTPVSKDEHWLVDGGLVNPVPVSLCRALGAEIIIAVNLNSDIVGRHLRKPSPRQHPELPSDEATLLDRWIHQVRNKTNSVAAQIIDTNRNNPGLFEVIAGSINIMQDRITRSRLADDQPDILLEPQLAHLGLLEFDRAEEAISIGYQCCLNKQYDLQALV